MGNAVTSIESTKAPKSLNGAPSRWNHEEGVRNLMDKYLVSYSDDALHDLKNIYEYIAFRFVRETTSLAKMMRNYTKENAVESSLV